MKKGLRKAVIDCGTNTFHLLIIEFINDEDFTVLHKEKTAVKIGVGGIEKNTITTDAVQRALDTLSRFAKTMKQHNVHKHIATATSAFRSATNGKTICDLIKSQTGITLHIIKGEQEATLIHKGVAKAINLNSAYGLIMDIGGGSVEFILCNKDGIKWLKSYEIGGIRLYEKFHKKDPMTPNDVSKLNEYLNNALNELFDVCHQYKPSLLIGASGSFDTLSEIYAKEQNIPFNEDENLCFNLPIRDSIKIINHLVSIPKNKRIKVNGMIPLRVDLIVVAGLLIKNIVEHINFKEIKTTGYALKEGLIYTTSLQE